MSGFRAGPRNSLTDVSGLLVGHAGDETLKSGATVILCDPPAVAGVKVLGGAPGTRETDLLAPENMVQAADAIVLSGGSAFGLDAASGVQAFLREQNRGFAVAGFRVPIVAGAILFDLANGGDKAWGRYPPYRDLGYAAAENASETVLLGSVGAGLGASTATVRGGLGTASVQLENGITVAAMVAVNALGSPLIGATRRFWAAPFEIGEEFGGLGWPAPMPEGVTTPRTKFSARSGANTTIAAIATDAVLDKSAATRLATAAHDGFARALWPAHTDFDGDLVFALATGSSAVTPDAAMRLEMAAAAAAVMARAIARGIHAAAPSRGVGLPAWCELG